MARRFKIVETEEVYYSLGLPIPIFYYDVLRESDTKRIKRFNDYLEALKYLEQLEERAWLVS